MELDNQFEHLLVEKERKNQQSIMLVCVIYQLFFTEKIFFNVTNLITF